MLSDRECCSNADVFLCELQKTQILSYITRALTNSGGPVINEAEFCCKFLIFFTRSDGDRQILVGETEGAIEAVVRLVDQRFDLSTGHVKISLLNLMINLLGRNVLTSRTNTIKVVASGGFRILHKILQSTWLRAKTIASTRNFMPEEIQPIQSCIICLSSFYNALTCEKVAQDSAVPTMVYVPDPSTSSCIASTTATMHSLFIICSNLRVKDALMGLFVHFCEYVHAMEPESLESTLLYSGETTSSSTEGPYKVPLVVQYFQTSNHPQLVHHEDRVSELLDKYVSFHPSVRVALMSSDYNDYCDTIVFDGASNRKAGVNVCANPGCGINSFMYKNLKKCSRCKAVAYCSKEHQTAHWKVHKHSCVAV